MKYKNYKVYDNDDFFKRYIEKRRQGNSPNETIEKPIIDELITNIKGKSILELGCGDGQYGRELLEKGAKDYHGIEGSKNMYQLALQNLQNTEGSLCHLDIEHFAYSPEQYDLIVSRLVFHYIENLEMLFQKMHRSLKAQGELVFSVEHPIITSCYESYHSKGKRKNWIVDNYFNSGERVNNWIEKEVVKYHKTLEEYFQIINRTKLELVELRESKPQSIYFTQKEEFERRMRIPLFLIFKLRKI